ncbi:3-oxoacyl-ACP reductase family protein [Phytohalomonas tamaricis]|uniref:3-oxoacyl-ACP reductase family protein n=1 Tax=Phytohalomonas tamaricis TaxID=2081032 RepID=UPI000D0AD622|nr:3-oxoacyl-ACP reductase family protein [Phytohalomonas tamaricis]
MDEIEGKVALVTGASRGIGRDIALALAEAGVNVAVNYHDSAREAHETVRSIEAKGRKALAIQADVSDANDVARLVNETRDVLGCIDILINNAGVSRAQAWQDVTADDWSALIAQNLTSSFLISQAVLPDMVAAGWGRLIMVSSIAAQLGGVIGPHYAASKAGQIGLAHSYASLLAETGVTSNSIAPALIETDMIKGNTRITPDILPVKRFGKASEVAGVAVMLARNGYITGQTINVNGGWYMS